MTATTAGVAPLRAKARHVWDVVEPVAAHVYFAPEAHSAYEALGFGPSPRSNDGIHYPDGAAYFASRGACLGSVPGEVVAAAFGVFKTPMVVSLVDQAKKICADPAPVLAARERGAVDGLERILGASPVRLDRATALLTRAADSAGGEGRHLYSGLLSLGYPGSPMGDFWRAADLVREHRGDSHIAAFIVAGFDACEIGMITDLWRGAPFKSWVRSRGWTEDELDAAADRLRSRGYLDGDAITKAGWQAREDVDVATDLMERRVVDALGDDIDELFSIMEPLAEQMVSGRGYPAAVRWGEQPTD